MSLGANPEPEAEHRLHGRLAEESEAEGQGRPRAGRGGQRPLAGGEGGRRRDRSTSLQESPQGKQEVRSLSGSQ